LIDLVNWTCKALPFIWRGLIVPTAVRSLSRWAHQQRTGGVCEKRGNIGRPTRHFVNECPNRDLILEFESEREFVDNERKQ
jgi:hypothetical protein